jgi:hypothetical protein
MGKGASGANREAEGADAPERGGLPRSSDEGSVMEPERREWVTAVELDEPDVERKAAAFVQWHEPDKSRRLSPDL